MTSRKIIKIFDFNGGTSSSTGMWQGKVFAISDCLVVIVCAAPFTFAECAASDSSSMVLTIAPQRQATTQPQWRSSEHA